MKKEYDAPVAYVLALETQDIVSASGDNVDFSGRY